MTELIEKLSAEFDYIIFDTPPVSLVSDALVLSDKINGYIIAARSEYSDINGLTHAVESIQNVNGVIFGTVLTDVNLKSGGRSNKYYHSKEYYKTDVEE